MSIFMFTKKDKMGMAQAEKPKDDYSDVDFDEEGLKSCMEELLKAIENKDIDGMVEAEKAFHCLMDEAIDAEEEKESSDEEKSEDEGE